MYKIIIEGFELATFKLPNRDGTTYMYYYVLTVLMQFSETDAQVIFFIFYRIRRKTE